MLFNKKTNKEKKTIDCMSCEYFDKSAQSCNGLGIRCIEKTDCGTKLQAIVDGKAVYLTVDEIKTADGQTLAEVLNSLKMAKIGFENATARLTKIEENIFDIFKIIET